MDGVERREGGPRLGGRPRVGSGQRDDLQVRGDHVHRDALVVVVVGLVGLADRVAAVHVGADVARAVLRPGGHGHGRRGDVARDLAGLQIGGHVLIAQLDAPGGDVDSGTVVVRQLVVGGHHAGVGVVADAHPSVEAGAHRGDAASIGEL